jgi:hypothetical protein
LIKGLRYKFKFHTTKQFINAIENTLKHRKVTIWLYAHNAQFDVQVLDLLNELPKHGWKIGFNSLESQKFLVEFRKGEQSIWLLDTMNYYVGASVHGLGLLFNISKLNDNLPSPDKEPDKWNSIPEDVLFPYCERDVEIIERSVFELMKFWRNNNLGNFQRTIASLAFNAFRHRFMHHDIFVHGAINTVDYLASELEIESYKGGRVEVFNFNRFDNIYEYDVNSLYPTVMKDNNFPVKLVKYIKDISVSDLDFILNSGFLVTAKVKVKTTEPVFGVKHDKDGRLIFPIGTFITSLTTPELKYATENNNILKVYNCAVYEGYPIFTDYVNFFYNLKRNAPSEIDKTFAKYMLNSLYGKFGQRERTVSEIKGHDFSAGNNKINYLTMPSEDFYNITKVKVDMALVTLVRMGDKWFYSSHTSELGYNSFVGIASHVTAYARMFMWKYLKPYWNGHNFNGVIYTDTDSLHFDHEVTNIPVGLELGEFKVTNLGSGVHINVKDYSTDKTGRKIKGVPRNSVKKENNKFEFKHILRIRESMRKGKIGINMEVRNKLLKENYLKGNIDKNGYMTPFLMEMK